MSSTPTVPWPVSPHVAARITTRSKLRYREGADPTLDRPAHVRAGSGLRLVDTAAGPRLLVAQDDASFFALVDPLTLQVSSLALPTGPDGVRLFDAGRGNKKDKLDLECVETFMVEDRGVVIALGSGSLPARERVVVARLDGSAPEMVIVDGGPLYRALRALPLLRDCELNLEGMCRVPASAQVARRVRLFHRGNGAGSVDATIDVDERALLAFLLEGGPVPALLDPREHTLGAIDGVRLTFTDACARGDRLFVTAAAEASPNAIDDGEVAGCALGVWDGSRWQLGAILDERGHRFVGKPEGLALDANDEARAWIVIDADDPNEPVELLTLALSRSAM